MNLYTLHGHDHDRTYDIRLKIERQISRVNFEPKTEELFLHQGTKKIFGSIINKILFTESSQNEHIVIFQESHKNIFSLKFDSSCKFIKLKKMKILIKKSEKISKIYQIEKLNMITMVTNQRLISIRKDSLDVLNSVKIDSCFKLILNSKLDDSDIISGFKLDYNNKIHKLTFDLNSGKILTENFFYENHEEKINTIDLDDENNVCFSVFGRFEIFKINPEKKEEILKIENSSESKEEITDFKIQNDKILIIRLGNKFEISEFDSKENKIILIKEKGIMVNECFSIGNTFLDSDSTFNASLIGIKGCLNLHIRAIDAKTVTFFEIYDSSFYLKEKKKIEILENFDGFSINNVDYSNITGKMHPIKLVKFEEKYDEIFAENLENIKQLKSFTTDDKKSLFLSFFVKDTHVTLKGNGLHFTIWRVLAGMKGVNKKTLKVCETDSDDLSLIFYSQFNSGFFRLAFTQDLTNSLNGDFKFLEEIKISMNNKINISLMKKYNIFVLTTGEKIYLFKLEKNEKDPEDDENFISNDEYPVDYKFKLLKETYSSNEITSFQTKGELIFLIDSRFSVYVFELKINTVDAGSVKKTFIDLEFKFAEKVPRKVIGLNTQIDGYYFGLAKNGALFGSSYYKKSFVSKIDRFKCLVTRPSIFLGTNLNNIFAKHTYLFTPSINFIESKYLTNICPNLSEKIGEIREQTKEENPSFEQLLELKTYIGVIISFNGEIQILGLRDIGHEHKDFHIPVYLSDFSNFLLKKKSASEFNFAFNTYDETCIQEFCQKKTDTRKKIFVEFLKEFENCKILETDFMKEFEVFDKVINSLT